MFFSDENAQHSIPQPISPYHQYSFVDVTNNDTFYLHHHQNLLLGDFPPENNPEILPKMAASVNEDGTTQRKSKATGCLNKNRHTKIYTAHGLRDRRVRLSMSVARKFFSLQEMLGFTKASKTLEWLLSKSKTAIEELAVKRMGSREDNGGGADHQRTESFERSAKIEKRDGRVRVNLLAREMRAKARARARQRTKDKMATKSLFDKEILANDSIRSAHFLFYTENLTENYSELCLDASILGNQSLQIHEFEEQAFYNQANYSIPQPISPYHQYPFVGDTNNDTFYLHHYQNLLLGDFPPENNPEIFTKMAASVIEDGTTQGKSKANGCLNKNRHTKIYTAHGLRDRRVRLSMSVARKFFSLQDILGFSKASKTLEWLFSKSKTAIEELAVKRMGSLQNDGGVRSSPSTSRFETFITSNPSACADHQRTESFERSAKIEKGDGRVRVNLLAREMRAKARARARQRTKEKIAIKSLCDREILANYSITNAHFLFDRENHSELCLDASIFGNQSLQIDGFEEQAFYHQANPALDNDTITDDSIVHAEVLTKGEIPWEMCGD
ncbi:hypothetical protein Nepgr_032441 [Nepenthes gracilis]|uniref:Uncharacterized protein n=1 Tax=Nepenthes gracilis TaxID=150966 RepID=A0AAD3Y619_NEPGR|nr:hypothetical protein Nepgr_032441 [Nepenthes gracilis]